MRMPFDVKMNSHTFNDALGIINNILSYSINALPHLNTQIFVAFKHPDLRRI